MVKSQFGFGDLDSVFKWSLLDIYCPIKLKLACMFHNSGLQIRVCIGRLFFFSFKTYVVGTQKNHLNETVLLSTQNTFKLMGKIIITI